MNKREQFIRILLLAAEKLGVSMPPKARPLDNQIEIVAWSVRQKNDAERSDDVLAWLLMFDTMKSVAS